MERGKLKPEHEHCIQTNYVYLKENLDAKFLIDVLLQEKIVTWSDRDCILARKTKEDRSDTLLQIILNSGPGKAFDVFLSALQKHQVNVWKVLTQELTKTINPGYQEAVLSIQKVQEMSSHKIKTFQFDLKILLVCFNEAERNSLYRILMNSETYRKKTVIPIITQELDGRNITFVESPCLNKETSKLIDDAQCNVNAHNEGFHAFLLNINILDRMLTTTKRQTDLIKSLYGPDTLKNYCVLLLTHTGELPHSNENEQMKEWEAEDFKEFNLLLNECGQRLVVINTNVEDTFSRKQTMNTLIDVIDELQFNGRRYTPAMYEAAEQEHTRMLVKEMEPDITKDTLTQCREIVKRWDEIKCEDSSEKLQEFILKLKEMKKCVTSQDKHTNILKCPMKTIEVTTKTLTSYVKEQDKKEKNLQMAIQRLQDTQKNKEKKRLLKETINKLEKQNQILLNKISEISESNNALKEECAFLRKENKQLKSKLNEDVHIEQESYLQENKAVHRPLVKFIKINTIRINQRPNY